MYGFSPSQASFLNKKHFVKKLNTHNTNCKIIIIIKKLVLIEILKIIVVQNQF